jgi:hypothetical protein
MQNSELNNQFTSCIVEISIVKDDVTFPIVPWSYSSSVALESLSFVESINSTNIGGNLFIKDLYNWSEGLNVKSFSKLIVKFINKLPTIDSSFSTNQLEFNIINVSQVTNRPITLQMTDAQTYTIIRFDFTTEDIFASTLDRNMFPVGKDFVGFIASDGNSDVPGLVNEIFKKLNIDNYEIEPTFNGIWIKSNELSYPWAKNKGQISLSNLMQYICNFAVSKLNPNAVNYFFWRDKNGYNFKSVEKLLNDQKDTEYEKIVFTNDTNIPNQVRNITQMHEANVLDLAKSKVFQTYYEKISPNYDEFYLDFVDTSLSFSTEIVDFDYHRDSELWTKVESYKIIPESKSTSVFTDNLTPIQCLKTDDNIYGYFYNNRQNTPFAQEWDHIGKTMDSRWNDVSYIPQYDITDLDINTFYTIHKKIREPLKEKRKQYAYLKNLKRKWEVYRCKVCCLADRLGGIQDQIDINRLQGLENPNENPDFLALFGPTGIFSDSNVEYRIVAAGSFSDVYNYDAGLTLNRGITLSYDLNSAPYNETIKDFYYFKDQFTDYEKYVLDGGLKIYDMHIEKNNQILAMINEWLGVVDGYIQQANNIYNSLLIQTDCGVFSNCYQEETNLSFDYVPRPEYKNNGVICYAFNPEEPNFPLNLEDQSWNFSDLLGNWVFECSLKKYALGNILTYDFDSECYPSKPYQRINGTNYGYYVSNTEGPNYSSIDEELKQLKEKQFQDIANRKAYCPLCLNPISLEISKRIATKQKVLLEQENLLLNHIKERLTQQFVQKWKAAKQQYLNRKAFFISKKEPKIENNDQFVQRTNLSLMNVKSIKRKAIRGSRYEILATKSGITGASLGSYLYNIFFDGITSDIGITGNHPYYDQTYGEDAFLDLPKPKKVKKVEDVLPSNDPDNSQGWSFGPKKIFNDSKLPGFIEVDDGNHTSNLTDLGYSNTIIRKLNNYYGVTGYESRYNLHAADLKGKKPPNIKREEISSYIRIEFVNPIGIESIADFPDGFIRTAGTEYFLPYLVSLTAGPNGRQTIKQNVVVIGMDPYGFDVAMKRIPDVQQEGQHYWWSSNLGSGEMDLWPEVAFETKYTYYIQHQPDEKYLGKYTEIYGLNDVSSPFYIGDKSNSVGGHIDTPVYNYGNPASRPNDILKSSNVSKDFTDTAKYDELLHATKNATNYLLNSHKVLKVHRNWWSFHIPENIIIMPKFESISDYTRRVSQSSDIIFDSAVDYTLTDNKNVKFSVVGKHDDTDSFYNYEKYKDILKLNNNSDVQEIVNAFTSADINFYFEEHHQHPTLYPYKDFQITNPGLKAYFEDITNYWMQGDHIIYKPALVAEDVWKYDLSGYSEYGMNFPPVRHNHGDIFDSNFAAQFVVFAKTSESLCSRNDLKCINPKGSVYSQGCPDSDPYCNCPAQNRKPKEPEPSYLELYKLEQELKECSLIEEHLGSDWLGCVWSNPKNTGSCNCPEIGDRFMDYLAYNRTYATFWSTPAKTPLLRNSQYNLLFAQTLQVEIPRNDNIKIGSIVVVEDFDEFTGSRYKRFGGKWFVTEITNIFYGGKDYMSVVLNRDSYNKDVSKTIV